MWSYYTKEQYNDDKVAEIMKNYFSQRKNDIHLKNIEEPLIMLYSLSEIKYETR